MPSNTSRRLRFGLLLLVIISILTNTACSHIQAQPSPLYTFGIITDVQYGDKDNTGTRGYRESADRLKEAVTELNKHDLAFTMQLGDIIDGYGKDAAKSLVDFEKIFPIFNQLKMPKYHVVGNHCLTVGKEALRKKLALESFYYDFTIPSAKGWRFIVLDGNDAGYGIVSKPQIEWLEKKLDEASQRSEKVIVFCHFPLFQQAAKAILKDDPESVLGVVLKKNNCVKAYFAGHSHAGGYFLLDGIHFVTVKAMVENPAVSTFSIIEVYPDRIKEIGFGAEPSRELVFGAKAAEPAIKIPAQTSPAKP